MIRTLAFIALASFSALAQTPPTKPETGGSGETELRARVGEFFQLQMDGKFRQAEKYVCESSQDAYYKSDKQRWLGYEIGSVALDEGKKGAKVGVVVSVDAMTPAGRFRVKTVQPTEWRLEEGVWCNHIPDNPTGPVDSPFGKMSTAAERPSAAPGGNRQPEGVKADMGVVQQAVSVSKRDLRVKGHEPSHDEVVFTNALPGMVELELRAAPMEGLEVSLSKNRLGAKETATLKVNYTPSSKSAKATMNILIRVIPTGQMINLPLYFDVPSEMLKNVPNELRKQ